MNQINVIIAKDKTHITGETIARLRHLTDIWFRNDFGSVFNVESKFVCSGFTRCVADFTVSYFGIRDSFQNYLLSDGNTIDWLRHFYTTTEEETFHEIIATLFSKYVSAIHNDLYMSVLEDKHIVAKPSLKNPKRYAALQKQLGYVTRQAETRDLHLQIADQHFPFCPVDLLYKLQTERQTRVSDDRETNQD